MPLYTWHLLFSYSYVTLFRFLSAALGPVLPELREQRSLPLSPLVPCPPGRIRHDHRGVLPPARLAVRLHRQRCPVQNRGGVGQPQGTVRHAGHS